MALGASAYKLDAAFPYEAEPLERPERSRRVDVRAVHTPGADRAAFGASALAIARMAAVLFAVVAVLCFARIALTSAAVTTMVESDALSVQIEEARTSGVGLEMQQSVLTSPSAIKQAVKRLGMAAPVEVGTIVLDPDIVALDEEGSLSFSESVKNVVRAQE